VNLILKRASISRPDGQWSDNDFDVLADGKVIGRIYENADIGTPPDMRWFWSVTEIVPGDTGPDERHRRDARRGDGEISGDVEKAGCR
jgi:hypothetical protein